MRATLRAEFDQALRRNAGSVAVECGARRITFAELDRWAGAVAWQLHGLGVRAGSKVALYARNCAEFLVVDVAIARLGAVKVPVNFMLPAETVGYIVRFSQAHVVVAGASLAARVEAPDVPVVELADGGTGVAGAEPLAGLPAEPPPPLDYTGLPVTADDPAALYFTGGTTGRPKGVLHSQRSTVVLHYAQLLEAELTQQDRLLLMTPLAHAAGLFAESALLRGATSVLVDGFDAQRAVELFAERSITWCFLVPTMLYRILDVLAQRPVDLVLRTIVYGAAPIAPARLEQALRTFGPVFVQLYGQTEAPNWGTRLAKSDHRPELLSSCGRASIMADVQVVDDAGTPVPPGSTGEICLRAPYTLDAYHGDPEATAAKFLRDRDGDWIRTGDVGVLDEQGYLYLRDRKNDMVISGGMNVYCREVEDVLSRHPAVRAVAVIGVPHADWGEAVHAVVVPADGFDGPQLLGWARDRLAAYARPKSVELVDALPETPFGKVDKLALRAPHWAGADRAIG